ncbi:hypothetical protein WQQ_25140 [Hydrocarboniphaga effusa AP103]|uniref:Uncharacterized protein n=1 Tax=Hydrocarboniphaga effusa AP103 TaxID=1172194 RepID=I7ZB94_9GAMM|nr:hypothetical protein WQQ_25140 [Hydrocarboniphaga effusa AP103]
MEVLHHHAVDLTHAAPFPVCFALVLARRTLICEALAQARLNGLREQHRRSPCLSSLPLAGESPCAAGERGCARKLRSLSKPTLSRSFGSPSPTSGRGDKLIP